MEDQRICPPHLKGLRSDYIMYFFERLHKDLSADPKVLDLGNGRWRHAKLAKILGIKKISCIDKYVYPGRPARVKFLQHDLENGIPFKNDRFDIIFCAYLLMFIGNREYLLREIDRVAGEGAFLIIEINEKPLKRGYPIDGQAIVSFLENLNWVVLNIRQRPAGKSFILKKG